MPKDDKSEQNLTDEEYDNNVELTKLLLELAGDDMIIFVTDEVDNTPRSVDEMYGMKPYQEGRDYDY